MLERNELLFNAVDEIEKHFYRSAAASLLSSDLTSCFGFQDKSRWEKPQKMIIQSSIKQQQ
jgi:hypothetical protein